MDNQTAIFKSWVPGWLIKITIFLVILPSTMLFAISTVNINAAAGYYGAERADIQYSMLLFYVAVATAVPLERRFFSYMNPRPYFLLCLSLEVISTLICYLTRNIYLLFVLRFIQGVLNCGITSICLTLIFSKLGTERAREIGYSLFYTLILCMAPFTSLVTAPIVDNYEFNAVYKFAIFAFIPGAILLLGIMNNVRLSKKMPLYQTDWVSFVLYSILLMLIGWVLVYGQQLEWLENDSIRFCLFMILLLTLLHVFRQKSLKRPFLHLDVFKYRNFRIGIIFLLAFYLIRGAFNITSLYFAKVLGMDPIHVNLMMLANLSGIILSATLASRLIILQKSIRVIWIYGFMLLLIFHAWMYWLFNTQAEAETFIIPLIVQGLGAGMLMTPIVLFIISSVPENLSKSASTTGVFIRFLGFSLSISMINFFQIKSDSIHYTRLSEEISLINPETISRLSIYRNGLISRGVSSSEANKAALGLISKSTQNQAFLHFAMDYYLWVCMGITALLLIISLAPFINKTVINVRNKLPSPASF